MGDTVIQIESLWKEYRLGVINHRTLTHDLQSWWSKVRGKEDPNAPIGSSPFSATSHPEDRFWALRDVSFEVKQGELLGIIGRNGAGKSTLLKILSQVTAPTRGEVRFKGRIASLLEVGTGFHPELTGRENVFLNGAILGMSKADIRRNIDEIVAFADVEKFIDTPVKRYSSGMYVRLAFAVAAHLEPDILVVDEVLAVGDAQFQNKCLAKMEDVGKQGRTILFVSHNMAAIQSLCPRACLLEAGKVVQMGASGEVVSSYLGRLFSTSGMRDLSERKDRVGGSALRLLSFDVADASGASMADIPCGKPARLVLKFRVFSGNLNNLRFGISLIDKNSGKYFTELNSYYGSRDVFSCGPGVYTFSFSVKKMPLAPGQYHLNFIVTSGLEVLDQMKDAGQVTVSDGLFYDSNQMPLPGSYPVFFTEYECNFSGEGNLGGQELTL